MSLDSILEDLQDYLEYQVDEGTTTVAVRPEVVKELGEGQVSGVRCQVSGGERSKSSNLEAGGQRSEQALEGGGTLDKVNDEVKDKVGPGLEELERLGVLCETPPVPKSKTLILIPYPTANLNYLP